MLKLIKIVRKINSSFKYLIKWNYLSFNNILVAFKSFKLRDIISKF